MITYKLIMRGPLNKGHLKIPMRIAPQNSHIIDVDLLLILNSIFACYKR